LIKKEPCSAKQILTFSGFGSKILCIKDLAPTGNQAGHENSALSICKEVRKKKKSTPLDYVVCPEPFHTKTKIRIMQSAPFK
jgi:hypothetical protein